MMQILNIKNVKRLHVGKALLVTLFVFIQKQIIY